MSSFLHVKDEATLREFAEEWLPRMDGEVVAIDIEEERVRRYRPTVALIQLTIEGDDAFLDPIELTPAELSPVLEAVLFSAESILLHSGSNDVAALKRDFGFGPARVGDTQLAARFLGLERFSLAALMDSEFDRKMDKQERRSDWTRRPLSQAQSDYARMDTHYLHALWATLSERVEDIGWSDALAEECDAIADTARETVTFDPFGWRKIRGLKRVDDLTSARAYALWQWREDQAAEVNLHGSAVVANWMFQQLAQRGVSALEGSKAKRGLHKSVASYAYDELDDLLDDPPMAPPRERKRRGESGHVPRNVVDGRVQQLAVWRDAEAERTGMEPGFLASRGVLTGLARCEELSAEAFAEVDGIREWRLSRYVDDWLDILEGSR